MSAACASAPLSRQGLGYSIGASLIFGIFPAYLQLLRPLAGFELYCHRVLWSVLCALILVTLSGGWPRIRALVSQPRCCGVLLLTTGIVAVQWWLFVWAPLNGYGVDVALGYFLLPLMMVLVGRLFLGERLRPLQWLAVAVAAGGVLLECLLVGQLSWVVLIIVCGYTLYFLLRRAIDVDTLTGFTVEGLLMLPVALGWLLSQGETLELIGDRPDFWVLLPGLGGLSSMSMLFYVSASRLLPVSLFGMLSFLEPALLFTVALTVLGESLAPLQLISHGLILLAVVLVCCDSAYRLWMQRHLPAEG